MRAAGTASFFETVAAKAREAGAAARLVREQGYRIGGLSLLIHYIGDALLPVIAPAIAHLEVAPDGAAPDLVLHCWDCTSLDIAYPPAPVAKAAFTPRGEVPDLTDDRYHVAFDPCGRLLSMIDVAARQAYYCVGDAALIPRFDAAEPIRTLLSWFMRANGRQLMHAGAVGRPEGGVLLLGRSGAGKSNTALITLNSGLLYASDDFCAVSAGASPMAYSLYNTAKTRESDCERNPFLRSLAPDFDPTRRDKIIYFLHRAVPEKLIAGFPLKAILAVRRGGDACTVEPIAPGSALATSAPDTAMLLAGAGAEVLTTLGTLVRRLPCYALHLGPDPSRIAPRIEALLDSLA